MSTRQPLVLHDFDGRAEDRVRGVENGNIQDTYRVEGIETDYYVQFGTKYPGDLWRGYAVINELDDTNIPVPDVVDYDEEGAVLITESLGSETLASTSDEEFYRDLGSILADVHEVSPVSTYGLFFEEEGDLSASDDNWKTCFQKRYMHSMDGAEGFFSDRQVFEIDCFFDRNLGKVPLNTAKSLLHTDLKPENVIRKEGEVAGIIDWDIAKSGDSFYDFVKTSETLERRNKPVEAFRQGYIGERELQNQELEEIYALQSNLTFLSAMSFQEQELDKDISDRNTEHAMERIDEILTAE